MQAPPAASRARWGFSEGSSLRKPAGEGASIGAGYAGTAFFPPVRLDQYLKWRGLVATGGEAKLRVQSGHVMVNGAAELRRGRQLSDGDRLSLDGRSHEVQLPEAPTGT